MNKLVLYGIIFVVALVGATFAILDANGAMAQGKDVMGQLAIFGAVAIAAISTFVIIKYIRQMQYDTATGELADENWDGIGEYKNELPFGWAVIFLGLTIWGMWYFLIGYPVNAYSQIGEYNKEVAIHNAEFEAKHANMDAATLKDMGQSVFIVQCAPCHGLQADGMDGKAANLNHRIEKASIVHTIKNGANNMKTDFAGGMPPMMLSVDADIDAVANYIVDGFPDGNSTGATAFVNGGCTGCHGNQGEGIPYVGPKLNGFDIAMVSSVLKDGKKSSIGTMPAFKNLTNIQTKAVAAYVSSLSK